MRHRNERRVLRKKIGALSMDAGKVRDELFASNASLLEMQAIAEPTAEVVAVRETLRLNVLRGIEAYIDALGKLVDVDDKMTSFAFNDDEAFHTLLVSHGWRGVDTVDRAKDVLTDEVVHRSVGKSDLALLLSSIDRTAFLLYGKMPNVFKNLKGEELIDEIVKSLMDEEFTRTLLGDPQWANMRRRWVRLGWRLTNEETFNAAFIRAAAERVAEIHNGKDDNVALVDTILDEALKEERQAVRDQMIEAFRLRLEREYDALPRRYKYGKDAEVEVTLNSTDVKQLDTIADRWNTTRNGAMERIVHEAVGRMPSASPSMDTLRSEAFELVEKTLSEVDPKDRVETLRVWRDQLKQRMRGCSDHDMMRVGRGVWETSYALGWSDEQVRDELAHFGTTFLWPDHLILFTAKWAVHAFQRLMTSHTFAAALMCSDAGRDVLSGIEKQWDAFLVIVPNGMLIADQFEFSRILVATYAFGARLILLTTGGPALHLPEARTVTDEAPTLADLLASEEADLVAESPTQRCTVMAKRLVAGLLLNLQHEPNFKVKQVEARPKSKKREAEPEHRIVTIGAPIEIDCREAVKEYIEHGKAGRKHGPPTVQVMVRGHYRRQAFGVGRMERKVIWISPFWRGNEAALIQTRAAKVRT